MNDEVRLYSKPPEFTVDVVAPQHQVVHINLGAWGSWCRERYQPKTCDSIEGDYDSGQGGREPKNASIGLPENPMHRDIDRVVRYMRMQMNQHGEAILLYYVGWYESRRRGSGQYVPCDPRFICRRLILRRQDFGPFMFYCRAAVINLLRRQGG